MKYSNLKAICNCIRLYQSRGYKILKTSPDEYVLLYSEKTAAKVRLYFYNSKAVEY